MSTSENIKSKSTWVRGLYIILFAVLYSIAEIVLGAIVLYQFGSQLLTASPNHRLLDFTRGLTAYIYQILQYISFRSDTRPYPFAEWPEEGLPGEEELSEDEEVIEGEAESVEEETDEAASQDEGADETDSGKK